jgi:hypothetical protein
MGVVHHGDSIGEGGGSGIGWAAQVTNRSALPVTVGTPVVGTIYLVENPESVTILGVPYKTYQSGLYIRDLNNGNLNDWRRLNVKVQYTDSEFCIVSVANTSKQARFDASLVTAGQKRVLSIQDRDYVIAANDDVLRNAQTGWISAPLLAINGGDNTKFDVVRAGFGIIVDFTDPANPVKTGVTLALQTGITATFLGSVRQTFIMVNTAGIIIQLNVAPTDLEADLNLVTGNFTHGNGGAPPNDILDQYTNTPDTDYANQHTLRAFLRSLGGINLAGLEYSGAIGVGNELKITHTSGRGISFGRNYDIDKEYPHRPTGAAQPVVPAIIKKWENSSGVLVTQNASDVVDSQNYRNNTTQTLDPVPPNKWQIQRIFFFYGSNTNIVYYGNETYGSKEIAIQAISTESFNEHPDTNQAVFRGYLILKEGATTLQGVTDAEFRTSGGIRPFGNSQGSAQVVNLQVSYDNSNPTPETLLNVTNRGLDYQVPIGEDLMRALKVLNDAGSVTWSVNGSGQMVSGALTYPILDGLDGYYIGTDGAGNLSLKELPTSLKATPYKASTTITAPPSSAQTRWNNVTQNIATEIYLHKINDNGVDVGVFLLELASNSNKVYIANRTDTSQYQEFIIDSVVDELSSDYVKLLVTPVASNGGNFSNNQRITVFLESENTGGGGGGSVDTLLFSNDGTLTGMTTTNDTTNVWISTTADSIEGTNSLCISNNAVNSQYDPNTANDSHIETDTFDLSATADNVWIKLTSWLGVGESAAGLNDFDFARCFIAFDTFTPVAGTFPSSGANIDFIGILKLQNNPDIREATFFLDTAKLAKYQGNTCKLVISWTNDVNTGANPGITIGGIEIWEGPALRIAKVHTEVFLDFSTIAVTSGVDQKIAYNFVIDDRQFNWDFNNNKFVCPEDGIYHISASEDLQLNAAGLGLIKLYKNGSPYDLQESDRTEITSSVFPSFSIAIDCIAGDELEIYAAQASGFAGSLLASKKGRATFTRVSK